MVEMKLQNEPFNKILKGLKTIEMRLNDEKRQALKIGDIILFTNLLDGRQLKTEVEDLLCFNNFSKLYGAVKDKSVLGYEKNEMASASDMEKYYSLAEQEQFGVVGIKIKLIK